MYLISVNARFHGRRRHLGRSWNIEITAEARACRVIYERWTLHTPPKFQKRSVALRLWIHIWIISPRSKSPDRTWKLSWFSKGFNSRYKIDHGKLLKFECKSKKFLRTFLRLGIIPAMDCKIFSVIKTLF